MFGRSISVADRTLQSVTRNLTARRNVLRQTYVAVCRCSKTNARRRMWLSLSFLDDDAENTNIARCGWYFALLS